MNSQSQPVVSSQEAANSPGKLFPVNFFTELGRSQMAMMAKSVSALCHGSEAMRGIQQSAAHEASVHHAEIAQKLFQPCVSSDLMAMQAELLRHNLQSAGKYWQQLAAQMMQTQVDMVCSIGEVFDSEKGLPVQLPMPMPIPLANSFFKFDPLAWTGGQSSQSAQDTPEKSTARH